MHGLGTRSPQALRQLRIIICASSASPSLDCQSLLSGERAALALFVTEWRRQVRSRAPRGLIHVNPIQIGLQEKLNARSRRAAHVQASTACLGTCRRTSHVCGDALLVGVHSPPLLESGSANSQHDFVIET